MAMSDEVRLEQELDHLKDYTSRVRHALVKAEAFMMNMDEQLSAALKEAKAALDKKVP